MARLTPAQAREVDAAVERHRQRQANPPLAAAVPNRIVDMQRQKRAKCAVRLGNAYNERIAPLVQSSRGCVVEGRGGQQGHDFDRGWVRKWLNAGARWETVAGNHFVVLENSHRKEVARIPVPSIATSERAGGWYGQHPGLIAGDLFGIMRHGVLVRYGYDSGQITKTRVSMPFDRISAPPVSDAAPNKWA